MSVHRGRELYAEYLALDKIAMGMREIGVQVAIENLETHRKAFSGELGNIQAAFTGIGFPDKFTLGKDGEHPSLRGLFFDEFKVPVFSRTPEGAASLDKKALEKYGTQQDLVGRTARMILGFRKNAKLLQDYIERLPLDFNNVVHPYWRVFGAKTGRWSATKPAFQTIPAGKKKGSISLRNLFQSRPGMFLVEADYEALEARIMATVYGGSKLLEWFAAGIDVHLKHAQIIFGVKALRKKDCTELELMQRELAKTVLYALAYGSSPETIWMALVLDNPRLELASVQLVYDKLRAIHSDLASNQEEHLARCRRNGYVEELVSGRRQYYHDGKINPNECLNFGIQGLAGTLANRAVLGLHAELRERESILAQVHDAVLLEGPEPQRLSFLLRTHMERAIEAYGKVLSFPVEVSQGTNWGQMTKVAA